MQNQVVAKSGREHKYFVYVMTLVAAIGGLLFGFDTGVISGVILFVKSQFHLTPMTEGLVVSAVLFGAFFSAALSGRFSDIFGRRKLLIITAIFFIIGTIVAALAPTALWLIVGRIIVGFAIGISSFTAPLYISEVSPPQHRGMLVSFNQLFITIGIVLSYVVDFVFSNDGLWRWMLGIGVIPAIVLLVGMACLPESPRWLLSKGFEKRAHRILQKIHAKKEVDQEFKEIEDSLKHQHGGWKMLFQKWLKPAIIIGFGLAFFQQVAGINTIIYYAPTIFQMAGFQSATSAILATSGVGVLNVLFTIIALPLIDKWGRRPLLIIGMIGMILSLAATGLAFSAAGHSTMLKWIALGSVMIYIPSFAISLGPIVWLMIAEIFPLKVRGLAASLCSSVNWGTNMLVAVTFLVLVQLLGPHGTFWLYSIMCIIGLVFIYFFVPETKGVTLERIEENLLAGKKCRDIGE